MVCGLSDVAIIGNQSLKNGLKYLAQFGNRLHVFTFFPQGFRNLQDPRLLGSDNLVVTRLPGILVPVMDLGRRIKDWLGRSRATGGSMANLPPSGAVEFHDEYSPTGRLVYILFLFFVYVPFECARVMWFAAKEGKPDLVYGLNSQGAVAASLLGRLLKRPVVTRFHGTEITERNLADARDRFLLTDQIAGLRAASEAVIMTNDGTRGDVILQELGVEPAKIRFWMNGVDTADLPQSTDLDAQGLRSALGLDGRRVLLMVSRLVVWKRVERGIFCLRELQRHADLVNTTLVIVGDGAELPLLRAYAEQLGVSASVLFAGGVAHTALGPYYQMADVFLSLYDRTNLGNPLLEAMYFGCPVVTIADGSTSQLLRQGESGFLIPLEQIEQELPEKVAVLLRDANLRESFRRNVQASYRANILTWEERIRLEHNLLQEIAQRPGNH